MVDAPELVKTFLAARRQSQVLDQVTMASLEQHLREVIAVAQTAWPEIMLSSEVFVRHLAAQMGDTDMSSEFLRTVHAADLYLACACAHCIPRALETFEKNFLSRVAAFLARSEQSRETVDEICQVLREKLFISTPHTRARIADYSGQGTLKNWLRVTARRTAISLHRMAKEHQTQPLDESIAEALSATESPELACIKQRYHVQLKDAFQSVLTTFSDEERNLLRLHLVAGLTLEQIARLFGVHPSTIMRRLEKLQTHLMRETIRRLKIHLRLDAQDLESLFALVRSQLDLSLSRILGTKTA